ncbi:hypothetical protein M0811_02616 [Anaeramoeba ignava]|uniref:Uncharacterized protein n=1 Tax=Anaeramoeba ignava TaxID=1746090 RepID=A0A9Q0L9M8_ANAIG|nr:hypothetical protein M0811_02616 [Anaeramoeba ignava]
MNIHSFKLIFDSFINKISSLSEQTKLTKNLIKIISDLKTITIQEILITDQQLDSQKRLENSLKDCKNESILKKLEDQFNKKQKFFHQNIEEFENRIEQIKQKIQNEEKQFQQKKQKIQENSDQEIQILKKKMNQIENDLIRKINQLKIIREQKRSQNEEEETNLKQK